MPDKTLRLAAEELDDLLDLALDAALARRSRGEELPEGALRALRVLEAAAHQDSSARQRLQALLPRILRP